MKRAAIASFAVGAVLAAFFVILLVRNLPSSPQPISGGGFKVEKAGIQLWSSRPGADPDCVVLRVLGPRVEMDPPSGSESITINGTTWYLVARSAVMVPAGNYQISCPAPKPGATYAVGPRVSIATFVLSILGLVFSILIFVGLGTVLLVIGSRRNRRKSGPGNTFPGNPPGYPQPGGPPGNTFPGYPPATTYNPGPNPNHPQDG
jgi:hypothetical protein